MRQVNQQLAYSDARIAAVARADERVERLQSVPSVGLVTAQVFERSVWRISQEPPVPTSDDQMLIRAQRVGRPPTVVGVEPQLVEWLREDARLPASSWCGESGRSATRAARVPCTS
jgi:endonuclease III